MKHGKKYNDSVKTIEKSKLYDPTEGIEVVLGTAKAKDNTIATEIKASFTRTADGYVYLAEFPGPYIRPIELEPGWNMGFCVYVADRDNGPKIERSVSLSTEPRAGGWNRPQTWPIAVLSE